MHVSPAVAPILTGSGGGGEELVAFTFPKA
jgi:hypothetical protein